MAWFTRISRFGDVHFVFGQEQGMTCGPSSALMCYTKINKLSPGAVMYSTTQRIKDLYAQWLGQSYDGSVAGTWPAGLAYALNRMGCGRWTTTSVSATNSVNTMVSLVGTQGAFGPVVNVNPIIVGVNWDGSTGSHWVVIDTIRNFAGNLYATVNDPWDAGLHVQRIESGGNFVYDAGDTMHLDFGGTHYEYSQPSTGRVRTWPIIHRQT